MRKSVPESSPISWEISIHLVTNPLILRHFAGLFGAVTGFFIFLLGGSFAVQGKWEIAGQISLLVMVLGMGLYLFVLVVMVVFYGNRQALRFTVSDEGVDYQTVDQRIERWNQSWVRRVLRGLMMICGGSLKIQQEAWQLYWRGAFHAVVHPAQHCIVLRNRWRTLMVVYCTPENFTLIRTRIDAAMTLHRTADRVIGKSPLLIAVWRTVTIVIAILAVFGLTELIEVNPLFPVLILSFGLAMVWLVPLMAWPLLVLIMGILGYIPIYLLQATHATLYEFSNLQANSLIRHGAYPRWQLLDGQEIFWIALGVAGIVYLIWLAVCFLRGRKISLMLSNAEDSGW
ncbi:MAG: hypothetical protein QG599_1460 [Pseudomonadota bacterium]|nr:hypothetical protein [Pseudomonadota bacterium]